ncbi:MAG TPA: hypothetical protein PKN36_04520 [bacterium]|nr:hypothetical protein [bacterium]
MIKYVLSTYTAFTVILTSLYLFRPDAFTALTIVPAWIWTLLLLPFIPVMYRNHKKYINYIIPCLGAWLLFVVLYVGVGNTILNDIPLLRIDQIWVSMNFRTLQSFAVKSSISDHKMVVSDIVPVN